MSGDSDSGDWPFYVGTSLAQDDNTCDDRNSSSWDPCLLKLECNDFTFAVPASTTPTTYKLVIRFNDEFEIESPILTILCSEDNCNSAGHGTCNSDDSGCDCDSGWSGDSCSYSLCDQWAFAVCDKDEFGNCGSLGKTEWKPTCFNATCDATNATTSDDSVGNQCLPDSNDNSCSNPNFEGSYCEIPTDFCSTFDDGSENACNEATIYNLNSCVYRSDLSSPKCLYQQCSQFLSQTQCEDGIGNETSTFFESDTSWTMFCEWIDDGTDQYCNRITCGGSVLSECTNGAVRRPIFDQFSDEPISICRAWYVYVLLLIFKYIL